MKLRIPPTVTDRAFNKIASSCHSKTLRVAVKGGGCSGFQYVFKVVENVNENDQVFEKKLKLAFMTPLRFSKKKIARSS